MSLNTFHFAKLSPNFSFSWAEMVFISLWPHPPNQPGKYLNEKIQLNIEKESEWSTWLGIEKSF